MHRRKLVPGFSRLATLGVAAILVFAGPGVSDAHWFSWFGSHGRGGHSSGDGGHDSNHGHDGNHGGGDDNNDDHGDNGSQCCKVGQCDDGNACTVDSCRNGVCSHAPAAGCQICSCDSDCAPANACSRGSCDRGVCRQIQIPGCTPCTTAAACADGDPCTSESCVAGLCKVKPINGCKGCTSCADCDDRNPCTTDQCSTDGTCHSTAIPGCVQCSTAAECDDQNDHTVDVCTGGLCTHRPIELPRVEICDDGTDNDGNGLADCADPACASFPGCAKPKEICGDCIDNDGDGLIDYEDPDCCAQPMALTLKKIIINPAAKARQDRLKMKSIYTKAMPASFDPTKQDTTIQIADDRGELFCSTIAAKHFMPRGQHSMAFWGDGSFSNGLTDGRFTVKGNQIVKFRTHGRTAQIRPTNSQSLRVTLRVGAHCSQATLTPRSKKTVLLFP